MTTLKQWHDKQMQDPEYAKEYKKLAPRYDLVKKMIAARQEQRLSQKDLAERIGTGQAYISRIESGEHDPSLSFLQRIAGGLGKNLEINFR